jgi:hypothetical protein
MKISELIEKLEEIRGRRGDLHAEDDLIVEYVPAHGHWPECFRVYNPHE